MLSHVLVIHFPFKFEGKVHRLVAPAGPLMPHNVTPTSGKEAQIQYRCESTTHWGYHCVVVSATMCASEVALLNVTVSLCSAGQLALLNGEAKCKGTVL